MILRFSLFLILAGAANAQWHAAGPFGGSAAIVQVDPHQDGTVLAAANNGLLFRSVDRGENWTELTFPAQLRSTLHAFVIDPSAPGIYLAGTASESSELAGLWRSRDAGVTWTSIEPLKRKDVWSLAIWKKDPKIIAAGTRDGVFLSEDGGENWKRISPETNKELQPVVSLAFDPNDSKVIYAGTPHLPWKTADGGAAWHSVHTGMLDDSDVFSINTDHTQAQRVYASACSGMYCSRNGGATWTKLLGAKGASYRTYQIIQDPHEREVLYAGTTGGLVKSVDGGTTWKRLYAGAARWVAFDPKQPGRIYVATDEAGILRSEDGGATFKAMNTGFCNRRLPSLEATSDAIYTSSLYEPASGGVFRWQAGQASWERVTPSSKLLGQNLIRIAAAPHHPELLVGAGYHGLMRSSNGGKIWTVMPGPKSAGRITSLLVSDPAAKRVLAGTETGLFRTVDGGLIWTKVSSAVDRNVQQLLRINDSLFAALSPAGVELSEDGMTWSSAAPLPGKAVPYGLIESEHGVLLAATSDGMFRSPDQGRSWETVGGPMSGGTVHTICKDPTRAGELFAAQYGILYGSRDAGRSWTRMSLEGAAMTSIRELAMTPGIPDRLFALTLNQGVFVLPLEHSVTAPGASR